MKQKIIIGEYTYTIEFGREIKKGELFLYRGAKIKVLIAKNDINIHDNSTHASVIKVRKLKTTKIMKPIDTFSKRLDEIFEDDDPTKALILDAFIKATKDTELLDDLAGKAMQGYLANPKMQFIDADVTRWSYETAQSMLNYSKHLTKN